MNAIELQDVCKHYPDFELNHVSLTLPSGCIMGLIGENGAGKTTLIRLIMGAVSASGGQIRVLGQENRKGFEKVRQDIGIVLSECMYPEELTALQLGKVLKNVYEQWEDAAFEGYLARFGLPKKKKLKAFSRGMKMKISVAAALSHQAKLLILDEATAGMDPVVRDEVLDILFEYTREEDRSILMSSHIVSDLEKLCDYIAFMHQGRLLLCEEKDRLCEQYGIWQGAQEELESLDAALVRGVRHTPYGVSALIDRGAAPRDMALTPAGLEDVMLYMIKGGGC